MLPLFRVFSEKDLRKIHDKTLWLLENTGVKISHKEGLKYLAENGALVNFETGQVRFQPDFAQSYIDKVPQSVILAGLESRHDMVIPHPENGFYSACATGPNICIDVETGKHRKAETRDVKEWVELSDRLENIDMVASPSPEDKPPETRDLYAVKTMLENTSKHCMIQPFSEHSLKYHFEMALAVAGGQEQLRKRPFITFGCGAFSPLSYKPMDIEVIFRSTHYGLPIHFAALPSSGATAPVTIAGAVLQCNVDILAGIIIAQMRRPGTPVIYSPLQYAMHMSRGINLQASPEALLAAVGSTQLANEFYHFPTRVYGVNTDSPMGDGQCMLERGLETPVISFAGADIVPGIGGLHCITTMSNLQLVIDDELIGTLRKLIQEVEVSDESLAAEVIAEVGSGGHFLDTEHTLKHFRNVYRPKIFSQMQLEKWQSEGAKSLNDRAKERLHSILREGPEEPLLPEETVMELDSIVQKADRELVQLI
jgi:trimethylamine--corrinoid protein Co-methyltransferase